MMINHQKYQNQIWGNSIFSQNHMYDPNVLFGMIPNFSGHSNIRISWSTHGRRLMLPKKRFLMVSPSVETTPKNPKGAVNLIPQ